MTISQTRSVFTEDQEQFRQLVRRFLNDDVLPEYPAWLADGKPSREFWRGAAFIGILGIGVPEQFGGVPGSDYRHSAVVTEEIQALAAQTKQSAEAVRTRLTQDGGLDRIRNRIRNEKTLDFLYHQSA